MQAQAQNNGSRRRGNQPLARRLSLRVRYARPEPPPRAKTRTNTEPYSVLQWLDALAESCPVRRTLVVVKRPLVGPSSLDRGSAATRTVVRSISSAARLNELTHISRINRR